MPQKDDLISRMQQQLESVEAEVRRLTAAGAADEAVAQIAEAQKKMVGLEPTLFERLPSHDLLLLLAPRGQGETERLLLSAELLRLGYEARLGSAKSVPQQARKALELYLHGLQQDPSLAPHYAPTLKALADPLANLLPSRLQAMLVEVFFEAGDYAEAENWLYRWVALEPRAAAERAKAFYTDLLAQDDTLLEAGGLPRDEVQEGLANLSSMTQGA